MRTRSRHVRTAGPLALSVAVATLAFILIAAPAASARGARARVGGNGAELPNHFPGDR